MSKAHLYIVLAAIFWGTMGVFVNALTGFGLNTVQIAMLRALASLLCMTAMILCRDRKLFQIRIRDIWMFFGTGIISYFLFTNCYFIAIKSVGVAISSVLLYTSPVFVTLLSCLLFKEKLTAKKVLCLLMAVCGCALVSGLASGGVGSISAAGIGIGLASGFAYALYSIFSAYALRRYQPITVTFYTFLLGGAAALLIGNPVQAFQMVANTAGAAWTVGLGVISGAIPYFLYTLGLQKVKPSHAAVIATVEPVVASLLGIFLFRETADLFTVLGMVLVIGASVILNLPKRNTE